MGERALNLLVFAGALATVAAAVPVVAAEQPLGRLFFTPAQRASLDVARSQRVRTTVATEKVEEETAPVPQTITYSGVVRRSDGKTTVWINNRAIHDKAPAGGTVVNQVRADGAVSLQIPQSGQSVELKVGQAVEILSGTVGEGYAVRAAGQPEPKPPQSAPGAAARAQENRTERVPAPPAAATPSVESKPASQGS